jgi:predicted transcriptional regulator
MEMNAMRQSFDGAVHRTSRRVAMSIRPELADAIYNGTKCFEFRRCYVRIPVGSIVLLYEIRPVARITGQFTVAEVIFGLPHDLIELESNRVARECAVAYLAGALRASALRIQSPGRWATPIRMTNPPQSYRFVD